MLSILIAFVVLVVIYKTLEDVLGWEELVAGFIAIVFAIVAGITSTGTDFKCGKDTNTTKEEVTLPQEHKQTPNPAIVQLNTKIVELQTQIITLKAMTPVCVSSSSSSDYSSSGSSCSSCSSCSS